MTRERWIAFPKRIQLLHIGAEFERARVWQEQGDKEEVQRALMRAQELIRLSLEDVQWKNEKAQLCALRDMVREFEEDRRRDGVALLYQLL